MSDKKTEALKLALEALEGFEPNTFIGSDAELLCHAAITAIREALAEQPAQQQEPVAWMYQCSADSSGPVLMQHKKDWAESGSGLWTETPLYTSPPANKPWVGLMRGVRVEGDTVIISVKGGNDNARELCGELLREKNA